VAPEAPDAPADYFALSKDFKKMICRQGCSAYFMRVRGAVSSVGWRPRITVRLPVTADSRWRDLQVAVNYSKMIVDEGLASRCLIKRAAVELRSCARRNTEQASITREHIDALTEARRAFGQSWHDG
jgi:hypothetical protein